MEKQPHNRRTGNISVSAIMANFAAFLFQPGVSKGDETRPTFQGKTPNSPRHIMPSKYIAYNGKQSKIFKGWGLTHYAGISNGKSIWALNIKNAARKIKTSVDNVKIIS